MPLPLKIEKRLYSPKEEQTKLSSAQVETLRDQLTHKYPSVAPDIYKLMVYAILDEKVVGLDFDNKKGSIYKRLQKWFWDNYSFKFIAKEGANLDILESTIQHLREDTLVFPVEAGLRRYMNWKAGDFGDGGSCYFGGNSVTRRFLETLDNFRALTVWKDGKGYGRGLMLSDIGGQDIHLLWNTYPSHSNCKFQDLFASALCSNLGFTLGEPYTHETVTLEQRNREGWFYTNGNKGALIYPVRLEKEAAKIDKQVMAFGERPIMKDLAGYVGTCAHCGNGGNDQNSIFEHDDDCLKLDKKVVLCRTCTQRKLVCSCCGKKRTYISTELFKKYQHPETIGPGVICGVCTKNAVPA